MRINFTRKTFGNRRWQEFVLREFALVNLRWRLLKLRTSSATQGATSVHCGICAFETSIEAGFLDITSVNGGLAGWSFELRRALAFVGLDAFGAV